MPKKICITILDYNNSMDTIIAYQSIRNSINKIKHNYDIVTRFFIVDNGSNKDNKENSILFFSSQGFVILHDSQMPNPDENKHIYKSLSINLGFAGGNNLGFNYAVRNKFDYIWLLNNDVLVEKDTLSVFLDFVSENHNNPSIIGSNILDYYNKDKIQSLGTYRIGWRGYSQIPLKEKNNEVIEVDSVSGCSMFIPISIIKDIGFFDEDLFLYVEETELSYRAKIKGYKSFTLTKSKIFHKGSQTLGKSSNLKKYYSIRNLFLFKKKHFSKFNLYTSIIFQFFIHIPKLKFSPKKWHVFFIAIHDAMVNNSGICKRTFK